MEVWRRKRNSIPHPSQTSILSTVTTAKSPPFKEEGVTIALTRRPPLYLNAPVVVSDSEDEKDDPPKLTASQEGMKPAAEREWKVNLLEGNRIVEVPVEIFEGIGESFDKRIADVGGKGKGTIRI